MKVGELNVLFDWLALIEDSIYSIYVPLCVLGNVYTHFDVVIVLYCRMYDEFELFWF